MSHRVLMGEQSLLRIFVGDFDKYQSKPLYEALLQAARENDLAGCTVLRGTEGFGQGRHLHRAIDLEGAGELPMVLEIVDEPKRICEFWKKIEPMLAGALVTEEKVTVHRYQAEAKEIHPFHSINGGQSMTTEKVLNGEKALLRIFVGESDQFEHHALHFEILRRARRLGLAGATAIHGVAGFGASSIIHTPHLFRLSSDLPIVIEIVDSKEQVDRFLKEIAPLLQGALVTEEKVIVHHYSHSLRGKRE